MGDNDNSGNGGFWLRTGTLGTVAFSMNRNSVSGCEQEQWSWVRKITLGLGANGISGLGCEREQWEQRPLERTVALGLGVNGNNDIIAF